MSNPPPPPPPGQTPPPPPPPPGYGAPQWGAQPPSTRQHPDGTKILVLGILGLVCCSPLGVVALVMGQSARKQMAAEPQVAWSNSGNITAGWVLGIIATCVIGLFVMVVLLGALTG